MEPALVLTALALGFVGTIFGAIWHLGVRRRLKAVRPIAIGKARRGRVKLVGRLKLKGKPLEAPLSGRRCAAYEVVVEEGASEPMRILSELRFTEFYLDDGTGRALVTVAQPEAAITDDKQFDPEAPPPLERAQALLARHEEKLESWLVGKRHLCYREGVLEEGELIAVIGECRREVDPDPSGAHGYREHAERVVIVGDLISDDPETTS